MRTPVLGILWLCLVCSAAPALAQTESELDALRAELAQMRADYESRIAQLEERLDAAENKADAQRPATVQTGSGQMSLPDSWRPAPSIEPMTDSNRNASNPAIGVIFQGQAWNYNQTLTTMRFQGFH